MTQAHHIWTVYDRPAEHPDAFVARRFEVGPAQGRVEPRATQDLVQAATLEGVRALVVARAHAQGQALVRLPRQADDDPKIVEVWL